MPGFWISRVIRGLPILVNMTGFWVSIGMQLWKGSQGLMQDLNLGSSMNIESESESCQRSKIECFGNIIIAFNYFCKTPHSKSLRVFWIYVLGFKYFKVLNTPGMSLNFQGYTRFTYFCKYDRVLNRHWNAITEGSQGLIRDLNLDSSMNIVSFTRVTNINSDPRYVAGESVGIL